MTRLKRNVRYQVLREHDVDIRTGVMSDQTIELTSARGRKAYPGTLRRVGYWDEETQRSYVFVLKTTRAPRRPGRREDVQPPPLPALGYLRKRPYGSPRWQIERPAF